MVEVGQRIEDHSSQMNIPLSHFSFSQLPGSSFPNLKVNLTPRDLTLTVSRIQTEEFPNSVPTALVVISNEVEKNYSNKPINLILNLVLHCTKRIGIHTLNSIPLMMF
jgi:hypothetical protein